MKRIRTLAGLIGVVYLVFGGDMIAWEGTLKPRVVFSLLIEGENGEDYLGAESFLKKNDARKAGRAFEESHPGSIATPSPSVLIGNLPGLETVYTARVHLPDGQSITPASFVSAQDAIWYARSIQTGGTNTWVTTQHSRLIPHDDVVKDAALRLLHIFAPPQTAFAETVLDPVTTTVVTLPTEVRTGDFTSPEVRFTTQIETAKFIIFLPTDSDWNPAPPGNSLALNAEYSPDSGGNWLHMCSSSQQYNSDNFPSGRPNLKDGTPNPGGSLSCSNRDESGTLRPASTWYRVRFSVSGSLTMGGEVRFSSQGQ